MVVTNAEVEASTRHGRVMPSAPRIGSDRQQWKRTYLRGIRLSDTCIVAGAVFGAQWMRFGMPDEVVPTSYQYLYAAVSVALIAMWVASLSIYRSRSVQIIGNGPEEYQRIVGATIRVFGIVAIVSLLLRLEPARLYLAFAFPVGLLGLLVNRWVWRQFITRRWQRGDCRTSVLVVGGLRSAQDLAATLGRGHVDGLFVAGLCIPGAETNRPESITVGGREIPVLGDETDVVRAIDECRADTVAVTATENLGITGMRKLVWDLDARDVDLVVAPAMMDISGPRLSMRPVHGLPLIHVDRPTYRSANRFGKSVFDLMFATAALVVAAPFMIVIALAIKLTSRGPIFYRSERIGIDGRPFMMWKFRSMVDGADAQTDTLLAVNEGAGLLFKIRDDPRVTTVGRFLRRYSFDELPQFFNVLTRDMSVVGPRPPIRGEVEGYDGVVRRRLLVRPGMTGLWQVSGRSDLSWDEAVRLDLSYVDNWSMISDVLIVVKTIRAVLDGRGAY